VHTHTWVEAAMFGISKQYTVALVCFYFLVEGFIGSMLYDGSLPLFFYYYKTTVLEYQRALVIGMLPWTISPIIAVLVIMRPIMGYHKRMYALGAAIALAPMILGITLSNTYNQALVFFTIVSLCISTISTPFDGQFAAMVFSKNASQRIAPFTEGLVMLGAILGVIMVGTLADKKEDAHRIVIGYAVSIPLVIPLIVYIIRYPDEVFKGDRHMCPSELREKLTDTPNDNMPSTIHVADVIKLSAEEILLALIMSLMSVLLLIITYNITLDNVAVTLGVGVVMSITLLAYVGKVYSYKQFAGLCAYTFLDAVMYADIKAAQDIYYTAPDVCVAGGPGFDLLFYTAWTKTIAYCISFAMMMAYMKWAINWNYRSVIMFGITLRISSSLTDVIIAKHWNRMIGISDASFYFFGDGMLNIPTSSWSQMCVVMASLAPSKSNPVKGKEIFAMALISGIQYMGKSLSRIYGMFLIDLFGITAHIGSGNCNFDNYAALSIAAHVVSAIFLYPIAYTLLPAPK
jgi:hypothetical protein